MSSVVALGPNPCKTRRLVGKMRADAVVLFILVNKLINTFKRINRQHLQTKYALQMTNKLVLGKDDKKLCSHLFLPFAAKKYKEINKNKEEN